MNTMFTGSDISLINLAILFKIALFFGIVVFAIYAFLLMARVKILSDTIFTPSNSFVKLLTVINIFVIIVGGLMAIAII